ncbi:TetR family transcriptional regulator [Paracoccus sp. YIM 132242]|uniref:TetR family transcriptional regulator n=1 Tax=Paracoccus lichenicola TaxID=2665644 RepID=A0A6L6HPB9_9RHOB|nr:TetR/AcrR family transcriptional regulator [Paracoccus lichenicola]MTE00289.1 TetR family transcriptional regulator [Paracoccus lichenicola]
MPPDHTLTMPSYPAYSTKSGQELVRFGDMLQVTKVGETNKPRASNISKRRKAAQDDGGAEYMAKRAELIRVAAGLFKKNGFDATTFNDIAIHTGLDRATLYYYFGSKQEIFQDAVRGALNGNLKGMQAIMSDDSRGPLEKLRALVEMFMKSYRDNYPYLFVYLQQDLNTIVDQKSEWGKEVSGEIHNIEEAFKSLIRQGIASGALRGDIPVSLATNSIFGMLNWTHRWYDPDSRNSPEQVADAFCKIFIDGMAAH